MECFITKVSWQFSGVQTGGRDVYLFMKFIKDPSLGPNFPPIKSSQLAQGKAIGKIPPYRDIDPNMSGYPDTYTSTYGSSTGTGSLGIIQVSGQASCFDKSYPCAPVAEPIVPAYLIDLDYDYFWDDYIPPSNHYVFYTDEGYRDSGALVPDSKDAEVMLTFLTVPEIETLAKALHPKLLPPDFLKPANGEKPLYAYVKFTVPNIESWNLSFSDKGICPLETIASTTVANMWELSEIVIETGDGEIVGGTLFPWHPRVKWFEPNNVYGPEYQRLERHEWTSSGTLYKNSW